MVPTGTLEMLIRKFLGSKEQSRKGIGLRLSSFGIKCLFFPFLAMQSELNFVTLLSLRFFMSKMGLSKYTFYKMIVWIKV